MRSAGLPLGVSLVFLCGSIYCSGVEEFAPSEDSSPLAVDVVELGDGEQTILWGSFLAHD